jgi:hypothetical protein
MLSINPGVRRSSSLRATSVWLSEPSLERSPPASGTRSPGCGRLLGWGIKESPRSVAALSGPSRQCAVDPAPPEAPDSGKKPAPRRSGKQSSYFGGFSRRCCGSSRQRPEAPRRRRSPLSGRHCRPMSPTGILWRIRELKVLKIPFSCVLRRTIVRPN